MKLFDLLFENDRQVNELDITNSTPREIISYISKHSVAYIRSARMAGGWLYRGRGNPMQKDLATRAPVYYSNGRADRKPTHSNPSSQVIFDYMLKKSGMIALRSNSIFCTGSIQHASLYGAPYIIFPLDGTYSYTYTRETDLILGQITDIVGFEYYKFSTWQNELYNSLDAVNIDTSSTDLNKGTGYITNLFSNYLPKNKDRLMTLGIDKDLLNVTLDSFLNIAKFDEFYMPKKNDLSSAIRSENEVYVSGEYYALSVDIYGDAIEHEFNIEVN